VTARSPNASAFSSETVARVWRLLRDQIGHVKPVEDHFDGAAQFIYDARWIVAVLGRER
jgi:hypothetical protein